MKTEIVIEENPLAFIRLHPPQTRKNIRAVIHALERGDYLIEPLENELDRFYKVKIEELRLIVQADTSPSGPVLKVVFAQRRDTVYDEFKTIIGL